MPFAFSSNLNIYISAKPSWTCNLSFHSVLFWFYVAFFIVVFYIQVLLVFSQQLYLNIENSSALFLWSVWNFSFLLHIIWDLKPGPMGMEGAVAVGYIEPLIWLDSVGSSFIHYIYRVKGYIYCLTGWKANEKGCHR